MAKLQNNFLKLYEEMNQLWEADDISIADITEPGDSPTSNAEYDFSFSTIVKKALDTEAGKETLDTDYWCKLRKILFNKHVRLGDIVASTWYGRFLSFYKTYRVECALRDWFDKNAPALNGVQFTNDKTHHNIWTEDYEAQPDFKTGVGYTIECKEYKSDSSIHGADLVIRHAPAGQKVIYFCLVGEEETLKAIFNPLPDYVYCLDHTRKLDDGFSRFPIVNNVPRVEMADYSELATIRAAFEYIDNCLENNLDAVQQKAALILDNHTKQLSKVIKASAEESSIEEPSLPSKDLKAAVANLTATAKNLEDVATSISEEN